eukprot:1979305-Amphidinium_carterae.1
MDKDCEHSSEIAAINQLSLDCADEACQCLQDIEFGIIEGNVTFEPPIDEVLQSSTLAVYGSDWG